MALVPRTSGALVPVASAQHELPDSPSGNRCVPVIAARPVLPTRVDGPDGLLGNAPFCLSFYTGTIKSIFIISNPNGITGFEEYSLANMEQRILNQSATTLEFEITVRRYVDTQAPYPVDTDALPEEVRGYLLPEAGRIQSDDPEIVAKAVELTSVAAFQVEAAEAILSWVRASVEYDLSSSLPSDASATFRNQSAICSGFANLAVALLRAAGIPARDHIGGLANEGWTVGPQGGWHAWVEIYYPDLGWIASDPQTTANFVDTSHIFGGFHQCGQSGTVISRTAHVDDLHGDGSSTAPLYRIRTPYTDVPWYGLDAAHVPALAREFQLEVAASTTGITLPLSNPMGSLSLQIDDLSCGADTVWALRTGVRWLSPALTTGTGTGSVPFVIDAAGMLPGSYQGTIMLYDAWFDLDQIEPRTITVNLSLTGRPNAPEEFVSRIYMPLVRSG